MKKVLNNKGFTLAELLIVVAIIAVLVAIAIPTFSAQLEKSRQSVDLSNLRGAYAAARIAEMDGFVEEGKMLAGSGERAVEFWYFAEDGKLVPVAANNETAASKGTAITTGKATTAKVVADVSNLPSSKISYTNAQLDADPDGTKTKGILVTFNKDTGALVSISFALSASNSAIAS